VINRSFVSLRDISRQETDDSQDDLYLHLLCNSNWIL